MATAQRSGEKTRRIFDRNACMKPRDAAFFPTGSMAADRGIVQRVEARYAPPGLNHFLLGDDVWRLLGSVAGLHPKRMQPGCSAHHRGFLAGRGRC
jgi:hypothetical protein